MRNQRTEEESEMTTDVRIRCRRLENSGGKLRTKCQYQKCLLS